MSRRVEPFKILVTEHGEPVKKSWPDDHDYIEITTTDVGIRLVFSPNRVENAADLFIERHEDGFYLVLGPDCGDPSHFIRIKPLPDILNGRGNEITVTEET